MSFFETISAHWHVIVSLAGLIGAVVFLYLAAKFVRQERCKEHREAMGKAQAESIATLPSKETLSAIKGKIAALENNQKDMPTKVAMTELKVQMATLEGSINTLEAKLGGYTRALEIIEKSARSMDNYLREHGVKR